MLTFNLKKEWFEKIKSGKKTHEYREVKPYWKKRLDKIMFNSTTVFYHAKYFPENEKICFKCGYPKSNETEKIMYAEVISFELVNGIKTDLRINKRVYDIEFKLIESDD